MEARSAARGQTTQGSRRYQSGPQLPLGTGGAWEGLWGLLGGDALLLDSSAACIKVATAKILPGVR